MMASPRGGRLHSETHYTQEGFVLQLTLVGWAYDQAPRVAPQRPLLDRGDAADHRGALDDARLTRGVHAGPAVRRLPAQHRLRARYPLRPAANARRERH